MLTKADLQARLDIAEANNMYTAPLGEVTSALIDRLDTQKCDQENIVTDVRSTIDRLDNALDALSDVEDELDRIED